MILLRRRQVAFSAIAYLLLGIITNACARDTPGATEHLRTRVVQRGDSYVYYYHLESGTLDSLTIWPIDALDIKEANGTMMSLGGGHVTITPSAPQREIWIASGQGPCDIKGAINPGHVGQSVKGPCVSRTHSVRG